MESRLPKPVSSMLKKPIQRVPADRMVNNSSIMSSTRHNLLNRQPLVTNFENIRNEFSGNVVAGRKRHASPEFRRNDHDLHRPKLRRSRSASDIQNENYRRHASRAPGPNLPTISSAFHTSKFSRSTTTLTKAAVPAAATSSRNLTNSNKVGIPSRIGNATTAKADTAKATTTASKPTAIGNGRLATGVNRSASATGRAPLNAARATASSVKNVTAAAAATSKPAAARKIPPYDYKARFLDLQEKHRVMRAHYQTLQEQMGEMDSMPQQLAECKKELHRVENELRYVQTELECLKCQNVADKAKIDELNLKLEITTNDLTTKLNAKTDECIISAKKCESLQIENSKIDTDLQSYKEKTEHLTVENNELQLDVANMKEMLFKFNIERKELHNTIMDLRGNIRVFCRVRPPLESELERRLCSWQYFDETSLEICK